MRVPSPSSLPIATLPDQCTLPTSPGWAPHLWPDRTIRPAACRKSLPFTNTTPGPRFLKKHLVSVSMGNCLGSSARVDTAQSSRVGSGISKNSSKTSRSSARSSLTIPSYSEKSNASSLSLPTPRSE
ncbi:hypothetical protein CRG98_004094, partial [Punica granatum]